MKTICFYFQIHQPFRLRRYRFFDIGSAYYYDDFTNEETINRIAYRSYLPANYTLLEMIRNAKGKFKVAFSISGIALEQMEIYVPEFIESMRELVNTGCVEILSETYAHSLASLIDPEEFVAQVKEHDDKIEQLFGVRPRVFRNTELIFDDDIAAMVSSMGFDGMITEGAKHILGWKSPNYLYTAASAPKLKLLLKNFMMSDDISFRFSNYEWSDYPLTAEKFIDWIDATPEGEQIVNLFMNYEALGELQPKETGIFEFMKALPRFAEAKGINFSTPSEAIKQLKPTDALSVPYAISWADEERDTSAWLGNLLQNEAFEKLYSIGERVRLCTDRHIKQDWNYLQTSDHFYYMCTKHMNDGAIHSHYSPYETPYEAFTNYMNVLSDFMVRVEAQYPSEIENEELNSLVTTIKNQSSEIEMLKKQLAQSLDTPAAPKEAPAKKKVATTTAAKSVAKKPATPRKTTKKKAD